jgi:hypothetical protein
MQSNADIARCRTTHRIQIRDLTATNALNSFKVSPSQAKSSTRRISMSFHVVLAIQSPVAISLTSLVSTLVVSTFLVAIALALAAPEADDLLVESSLITPHWDLMILARRVPHEMTKLAINSLSVSPAIHSRTRPSDRHEHVVHHAHSDATLLVE